MNLRFQGKQKVHRTDAKLDFSRVWELILTNDTEAIILGKAHWVDRPAWWSARALAVGMSHDENTRQLPTHTLMDE